MAIRVVKFPIKINQIEDAESIRRFDEILELSTCLWNSFSVKFKDHYEFNRDNNTFHYENVIDENGKPVFDKNNKQKESK